MLLAGGGGYSEKEESNKPKEQVLTVSQAAGIKTLDVSKATDIYASAIFEQVMEGLTRVIVDENGNDKIVPGIAESWEKSEDGLVWTFYMRKNAKWSDGVPVVAEDYKYSIMRTLNPETGSTYAFILSPIKNANLYNAGKIGAEEVGIEVIDDYTIKFTLENPTSYFLSLTAYKTLFPQRKDVVEKFGNKNGSNIESVIGNGPFKLVEWIPNNKLTLVKSDTYWDAEVVKLDKVNIPVVLDSSALMNMLYNGQVDLAGVSKPEWVEKFTKSGKFNVTKGYTAGENYGIFNLEDPLFKNKKVRQAFSLAVTRDDLANVIFHGLFEGAYGWTPPAVMIGDKEYRAEVPEPLKALEEQYPDPKTLLIEGLEELGIDPDPANLEVTYLNASSGEFAKRNFEYFQQMWRKTLGVTVKGEFTEWAVFQKRVDDQDFQLGGLAWIGDYNDPSTFFDIWKSDAKIYNIGFNNAEYDQLITNAAKESDDDKRLEMFARAEIILVNEVAAIYPTNYRKRNTFIKKGVKDVMIPLFGSISYKYASVE